MGTIYDSGLTTIDANGDTEIDLQQGEDYVLGFGGTFDSGSLTFFFVDGDANDVPVPAAGETDGVANPLTVTAGGMVELPALTAKLKITTASGGGSMDIDVTATKINAGK